MEGIYQNQAEINTHLFGTLNPADKPGDIKFKDLNGDGVINDDDRTFIGNPIPKLSYGLNLSGDFRRLRPVGVFPGSRAESTSTTTRKQITDYDSRPFNHSVAVLGAWNGEGTSNTIPRTTFNDNGSSKKSSIFVEDASYFRLKNSSSVFTRRIRSNLGPDTSRCTSPARTFGRSRTIRDWIRSLPISWTGERIRSRRHSCSESTSKF